MTVDATTLRDAIDRLRDEYRNRLDTTLEVFDYVPAVESAPHAFVYISADGASLDTEAFRVPVRLVVSGQAGHEESHRVFVNAVDMCESELDAASLGATSSAGWQAEIGAWVCAWIVEIPRSYPA